MDVLVTYESHLGHTRCVAQAIAGGMLGRARVVIERCRPDLSANGFGLVVVGAPTHRGRLPTANSRTRLLAGLGLVGPTEFGLREWLDLEPVFSADAAVAVFDTLPPKAGLSRGSAAREVVRILRRFTTQLILPPRNFLLTGPTGPLHPGELAHARQWADRLVATDRFRAQLPGRPEQRGLASP